MASKPGTYDALSHLLFTPIPNLGSSGGPIVEEESGAVVGVMLGSRMDNCAEGVRGWGVPSEILFEVIYAFNAACLSSHSPNSRCFLCQVWRERNRIFEIKIFF